MPRFNGTPVESSGGRFGGVPVDDSKQSGATGSWEEPGPNGVTGSFDTRGLTQMEVTEWVPKEDLTTLRGDGSGYPDTMKKKQTRTVYAEHKAADTFISRVTDTAQHVVNSMKVHTGLTQNLWGMIASPKLTPEVARGLGYASPEEAREFEVQEHKKRLLRDASMAEQIAGGLISNIIDPVAITTSGYGLSAQGLARVAKLSLAGGSYAGSLEATKQLADEGSITDPNQILLMTAAGAIGAPALDKIVRVAMKIPKKAILKAIERDTQDMIQQGGMNPQAAYDKALEKRGFTEDEIASLVDATGRTTHRWDATKVLSVPEKQSLASRIAQRGKSVIRDLAEYRDDWIEPITSRIGKINMGLKGALRKVDHTMHIQANAWRKQVQPFIEQYTQLPKDMQRALKKALLNQDADGARQIVATLPKAQRDSMYSAMKTYEDVYKNILEEYRAAGVDVGELSNYFHRVLKDGRYKSLMEKMGIEERNTANKALYDAAKKKGAALTFKEQSDILNSVFLGIEPQGLRVPRITKARVVRHIDDNMLDDYADLPDALNSYIDHAATTINERKFFGKNAKSKDLIMNPRDTVGSFVADLSKRGEIDSRDYNKLIKLLEARFGYKPLSKKVQVAKNIFYMTKLAQVDSAITQLGDLGLAAYSNGWWRTTKVAADQLLKATGIKGRTALDLIPEDIGALKISQEFGNTIRTARTLDKMFHLSGFSAVDKLGKTVHINGALRKNIDRVKMPASVKTEKIDGAELYSGIGEELGGISHMRGLIAKAAREFDTQGAERGRVVLEGLLEEDALRATNNMDRGHQINPEMLDKYTDELAKAIQERLKQPREFLSGSPKALQRWEDSIEQFRKDWTPFFGKETEGLIRDLQKGRVSDNVRLLLWNELSDVQPISLSEMPLKYLNASGGRLLYALKTFTIKQLDLMRRTAFSKIKRGVLKGDAKLATEGAYNLTRFTMLFTSANMTADGIKNWIFGRDEDISDMVVDNMWKNFGVSQFLVDKVADEGKPLTETFNYLMGAYTGFLEVLEDLGDDTTRFVKDIPNAVNDPVEFVRESESLKNVPLAGRILYNLFGEGARKRMEREAKSYVGGDDEYNYGSDNEYNF